MSPGPRGAEAPLLHRIKGRAALAERRVSALDLGGAAPHNARRRQEAWDEVAYGQEALPADNLVAVVDGKPHAHRRWTPQLQPAPPANETPDSPCRVA
jgi:hypothetical protein